MSEHRRPLDYEAQREHDRHSRPGQGVLALSLIAAAPVAGVFAWMELSGQPNDWVTGLIAIPFIAASTLLSPIALVVSIKAVRRSPAGYMLPLSALLISAAATSFCVWIWVR